MPSNSKTRSEANILNDCLIALSDAGCQVWRNNTGLLPGQNGRPVRFGLCVGSSDIIGMTPDGVFLAVECKTATGRVSKAQRNFIERVRLQGGRAGVARSGQEAVHLALGGGQTPTL